MIRRSAHDIDEQAARYVAQMDGEHWSDAQEQGLQHWLALDSRHPGALLRAQAAWMALDPPRPPLSRPADESKRTIRPSRRSVRAGGGVATASPLARTSEGRRVGEEGAESDSMRG